MEFSVKLEHFAQMRALHDAYISTNSALVDHALNSDPDARETLKVRRIQFDAWEGLAADLERVCARLDCTKRQFLEFTVSEAVERAEAVYEDTLNKVSADMSGVQLTITAVNPAEAR